MAKRVAVFIDYQNTYRAARKTFEYEDAASHYMGQFDPLAVSRVIVDRRPERVLSTVRIYRGLPDGRRDPKGHAACQRQLNAWSRFRSVAPIARPLRYPSRWPDEKAQEKGIDVKIAIDFVMMAIRDEYDVGVIFSRDTDLRPPLEAVEQIKGSDAIEVAAWQPDSGHGGRLSMGGSSRSRPWCHFLGRDVYETILDLTDYNRVGP